MDEELLRQTPLTAITPRTLSKIANRLDQRKCLLTADDQGGNFRDWRGLLAFADLEHDDEQSVLSKKENLTSRIVILWSRKPKASVFYLVQALRSMDRLDVVSDYSSVLLEDCQAALQSMSSCHQGIDQALTLQDLEALSRREPLTHYDAVVLFGDSDLDAKFGLHVVERLEAAGKKVFLYDRDLIIGAIEQEAAMRILRARCRKVIAILTPTFHMNKISLFLTQYALHLQNDSEKMTRILPVIYSSRHLDSEVMKNIAMYSKLKYDKGNTYFWRKLFGTLGDTNVHPDLLSLSFPMPHEFDSQSPLNAAKEAAIPEIVVQSSPVIQPPESEVTSKSNIIPGSEDISGESITSRTQLILPDAPSDEPSSPSQKKTKKRHKSMKLAKWLHGKLSLS